MRVKNELFFCYCLRIYNQAAWCGIYPLPLITSTGIVAIIITYNPEQSQLELLLDSAMSQVDKILIVDNGSHPDSVDWIPSFIDSSRSIEFHPLGENLGIATAQNIGIALAKERGAEYVLLFDHDSLPASDMVAKLLAAIQLKQSQGILVGAVGPWYEDPRKAHRTNPFVEVQGFRLARKKCNLDNPIVTVSHLIASGSLTPMTTFDAVGVMRDDLFIDYVDIEWGLRAYGLGYQSFGVCNALMDHDLGDDPIIIFGKSISFHSPLRHYYQFRNAIWLYRQSYLPLNWKVGDASRLFLRFGFYILFAKPHLKHWKMMLKGLFDGVLGRVGKAR